MVSFAFCFARSDRHVKRWHPASMANLYACLLTRRLVLLVLQQTIPFVLATIFGMVFSRSTVCLLHAQLKAKGGLCVVFIVVAPPLLCVGQQNNIQTLTTATVRDA